MKIVLASNGGIRSVTMLRDEWRRIGIAGGWIKEASMISLRELERRLLDLGWTERMSDDDHIFFSSPHAPGQRPATQTTGIVDYERNWHEVKKDFVRQRPDLQFVWKSPFVIPENFDLQTQSIRRDTIPERRYEYRNLKKAYELPRDPKGYEILIGDQWRVIEEVDQASNEMITPEGEVFAIPAGYIQVRRELT
jgi:hypothetical protein